MTEPRRQFPQSGLAVACDQELDDRQPLDRGQLPLGALQRVHRVERGQGKHLARVGPVEKTEAGMPRSRRVLRQAFVEPVGYAQVRGDVVSHEDVDQLMRDHFLVEFVSKQEHLSAAEGREPACHRGGLDALVLLAVFNHHDDDGVFGQRLEVGSQSSSRRVQP